MFKAAIFNFKLPGSKLTEKDLRLLLPLLLAFALELISELSLRDLEIGTAGFFRTTFPLFREMEFDVLEERVLWLSESESQEDEFELLEDEEDEDPELLLESEFCNNMKQMLKMFPFIHKVPAILQNPRQN